MLCALHFLISVRLGDVKRNAVLLKETRRLWLTHEAVEWRFYFFFFVSLEIDGDGGPLGGGKCKLLSSRAEDLYCYVCSKLMESVRVNNTFSIIRST